MYEHYWRLDRPAFENDCDPTFFFPARSHHGALLKLRYLLENQNGLGLLVGEHGLGKTYLTHVLVQQLESLPLRFVRIVFPLLRPEELLRYVAHQLGMTTSDGTRPAATDLILLRLEAYLEELGEEGRRPVLIVDDAHLLAPEALQALQLLLNLKADRNHFALILVGRSDLLPKLNRLPALADRVAVRASLQPLTLAEAEQYVRHRLKTAGVAQAVLQPAAIRSAWQLSQGHPRRLNQLCDLALLVGYADGRTALSPVEIEAAAEELTTVSLD